MNNACITTTVSHLYSPVAALIAGGNPTFLHYVPINHGEFK